MGIKGKSNATLEITDSYNLKQVDLFAVSKGLDILPPWMAFYLIMVLIKYSTGIQINGNQNFSVEVINQLAIYIATFANPSSKNFNASIKIKDYVHSYYAYAYRTSLTAGYKSIVNLDQVFMYHNGSENAYVYTLDVGKESGSRDINIKIPISELDEGYRMIVIDIEAGPKYQRFVENTYNSLGNSLLIGEYQLKDVPGNISQVTISIVFLLTQAWMD